MVVLYITVVEQLPGINSEKTFNLLQFVKVFNNFVLNIHIPRQSIIEIIDLEKMDRQHRSTTTELASTRTFEKCWLLTSGMNLRAVIRS